MLKPSKSPYEVKDYYYSNSDFIVAYKAACVYERFLLDNQALKPLPVPKKYKKQGPKVTSQKMRKAIL